MAVSKTKKSAPVASAKSMKSSDCERATNTLKEVQRAQEVLELKIKAHAVAVSAAFFTA